MEINRKSAESMIKFYTCFPISMDGNQLSISMVPENMNIKDEVNIDLAWFILEYYKIFGSGLL